MLSPPTWVLTTLFILFISEDGNWDGKCHVLRLAIPAVGYDRGRAWAKQSRHECMVAVSVSCACCMYVSCGCRPIAVVAVWRRNCI